MLFLFLVLASLLLSGIWIFNSLVAKQNDVTNAFGSVDVMLRRRYDLIPKLVDSVKGYMNYERTILTELTDLRTRLMTTDVSGKERIISEDLLTNRVRNIMVAAENYPELKSNASFLQLQAACDDAEEQIAASRRSYNASVREYNNSIQMFPANLIAKLMNFKSAHFPEINSEEKVNPMTKSLSQQS
ncbi:MAG: LemA family protein [Prolixibacteraceae bacterium]